MPNHLVVTYLSNAGNRRSGVTPDRGNPEYYNGSIKWIKTGELNNNILYDSIEKVTNKALKDCSLPVNDVGNILIAIYGATIGKLAIAGTELTTNQACCGCKPFNGIYNKYLFYYLMYYKPKFIDSAEGGAQPNISREKILAIPFILPNYRYQIKLVEKIEYLFDRFI